MKFLLKNEGIKTSDLEHFTETTSATLKSLEKKGYIKIVQEQIERNPLKFKQIKQDSAKKLTDEQSVAYSEIAEAIDNNIYQEFLLYGVTGSGKTEVYLQLIEKVIKQGKSAVMLVPEISLTPQMINRFIARFGKETIAVLHSKLSYGERFDNWQKIYKNQANIVIGARSAIFAPVQDVGIIIIDEEHDTSYKSETTPRFNAKEIATFLCKQHKIPLVLGSATPNVTTFYKTKSNLKLLKLTKRANNSALPQVDIVDLREELAYGNKTMISRKLHEEIAENLKNKKQTILFLNRRGYSTYAICMDCGYTMKCKNCNIPLTQHLKEQKLKCHYCGYTTKPITTCPSCQGAKVKYVGAGTQKLETAIQKMFPEATTIRMDIDTVTKKNSHEQILETFQKENIDILIGTQMVVKGHHFPNVTLVGVILADNSLNMGDFQAPERTFQILTQVAGRAGRENLPGKVIIQTYNPDSYAIECAKQQNYDDFYSKEINLRKQLKYPPFCDIIIINISSEDENEIQKASNFLYNALNKGNEKNNVQIFKPLPAPIDKIKNKYRWRIIIKGKLNNNIIDIINTILLDITKKGFKKTSVIVDVNPNNMM